MLIFCAGDKDVADCRGVVRTVLAASATLQSTRRPVSRNQLVSFAQIPSETWTLPPFGCFVAR